MRCVQKWQRFQNDRIVFWEFIFSIQSRYVEEAVLSVFHNSLYHSESSSTNMNRNQPDFFVRAPFSSIRSPKSTGHSNCVQLMKVVEVIKTDKTDPIVLERGIKWVEEIGKVSVLCDDTPGMLLLSGGLC